MKLIHLILLVMAVLLTAANAHAWGSEDVYRLEAGVGYASSTVDSEYLKESVDVGGGPAVAVNFWKDGAFDTEPLSLGIGYKYHYAEKSVDTTAYSGSAGVYAHDILLRLALRNNNYWDSTIHPYAGIGLGVTHLSTDISDETTNGYTAAAYLGLDYDIEDSNYYLGGELGYTRTWADVYGYDFTLDTWDAIFKLGFKF